MIGTDAYSLDLVYSNQVNDLYIFIVIHFDIFLHYAIEALPVCK